MSETYGLKIEIKNTKPVELVDLTNSLLSLADEYRRYLIAQSGHALADEIKLYVKEIKTGSIITELMAIAPAALPFIEYAMTVIDFSGYVKNAIAYFLEDKGINPSLERRSYENLSRFIEPIAKDNGAQLNWHQTINGNPQFVFNVNAVQSNALQNAFRKQLDSMHEPISGMKTDVVLYWYQARNDPKSQAGDRAIIESISMSPVKTVIDEETKAEMLSGPKNPFNLAYRVDVDVETVNGKPMLYKVKQLNEKFDKG